jgi:hypothetical protein
LFCVMPIVTDCAEAAPPSAISAVVQASESLV